ncbi:MAG: hypothetical protein IJG52_06755 [Lachnospiraceae bacterium]|nr:hypothetical protein [Lachnospiraceae bacterium]
MKENIYTILELTGDTWSILAQCGTLPAARRICRAMQHAYPKSRTAIRKGPVQIEEFAPLTAPDHP